MLLKCAVPFCKNYYKTGPKVATFDFSKNEELKKEWIATTQRKDYIQTKQSPVCFYCGFMNFPFCFFQFQKEKVKEGE